MQANHAVVFARCIVEESDYGVLPFLVPIRDYETHEPLPGVEVGDIGVKLGYLTMDNGYLKFNHFRIPRTNLLSRFASISSKGNFKMKGNPKIIYQIMVQTRIAIVFGCSTWIMKSASIAVRYSICRRQFATIDGSKAERKVIDYQLQMDKLAPNMCNGIVI